ncbi:general secretion pathway protein GspL [Escherichia coli]|uniref:General secretion pathway protein GspL n=1 Tax=Escherichia coli TaxID=562 RepID=A0A3L5HB84_ECOLX|nr:general secretion pathway protein GspL [Escherichia coli]EEW1439835.1 general secretion pathway protein GspL [Escherichia coli]EEW3182966.1 general secretion pathway protein GspL [Escherichia coli]EEW6236932.1 general secretion pathway protein GspL [Escherichia coli]EFA4381055.1 general secretion pathway protein GspL [Escherichia coli]
MSIYIDGRDCCQTGQFSQDVADGALTYNPGLSFLSESIAFSFDLNDM